MNRLAAILAVVFVLGVAPVHSQPPVPSAGSSVSTMEDLQVHLANTPCKNKDRLAAARAVMESMGAPADAIAIEGSKSVENLVVTCRGSEPGRIVVSAHYDHVEPGCGAIDNWTGIVTLAHLYRSVTRMEFKKTIVFAAFAREEQGLIGSRKMAGAIARADLPLYCANVNIDSLGLAAPFALENASSRKMVSLTAHWAEMLKIPFDKVAIQNADTDSSSFLARGIPSVTISGLSNEWEDYLHTKKDQPSEVKPLSVYLGYRLALAVLVDLDNHACGEFAEKQMPSAKTKQ